MSGKLVVIKPDGSTIEHRIESKRPTLEILKELVQGWVERVRVRWEGKVRDAYVDEEGLIKGLQSNRKAIQLLAPPFDPEMVTIVGTLVIWVPDSKVKN